ncbi:MAG: flagellar basal body rod protein FlgB [Candidatus Melainabacteria bacterium]
MDIINGLTSDLTGSVVQKSLDGLSMRHKAIASNLANVETPNYRRKEVRFEAALSDAIDRSRGSNLPVADNSHPLAMKASAPGHFALEGSASVSDVTPGIEDVDAGAFTNDGNTVDLESEAVKLAENTERYMALSNLENRRLRTMHAVIQSSG